MNSKKMEDQNVDTSVLLRRGDKLFMGGRVWKGLGRNLEGGREIGHDYIWEETVMIYRWSVI